MQLKYASLFSGIGGFELGIEQAAKQRGISTDCVFCSEIDEHARRIYQANFGVEPAGDITQIPADSIADHDLLVGGFPCFAAGNLVLTEFGFKPIENIHENDIVLTHTGSYNNVIKTMSRWYDGEMISLDIPYGLSLECTDEHPFYVRDKIRTWNNEYRKYDVSYTNPYWSDAKNLKSGQYVGIVLPIKKTLPVFEYTHGINGYCSEIKEIDLDNEIFWWCVGHYIAEGWYEKRRKRNGAWRRSQRVIVCTNKHEIDFVKNQYESIFSSVSVTEEKTVYKIHIINRAFYEFVSRLGDKAFNKQLPPEFIKLPEKHLNALLDGYIFGDGCILKNGLISISTTSSQLASDLQYALAMRYRMLAERRLVKTSNKTIIEGREVNQRDWYQIRIRPNRTRQIYNFYDDGIIWVKIKGVEKRESKKPIRVYNFEVEGDNSYTIQGIAVHNCQPFSMAGQKQGIDDCRGTLFFEMIRIAQEKQPRYLIFENVRGLMSNKSPTTPEYVRQLLNDEIIGNALWVEKFTPMSNWTMLIECLSAYLQEKLLMNLDSQSRRSDICNTIDLTLNSENLEHLVELGLKTNLQYFADLILQTMKKSNFCQTELLMQLKCSADDLDSILNQLYSIENLNQLDMSMLEKMVATLGDAEKLLRSHSDAHLTSLKLYTTSMEIQPTIDQKICTCVQDLTIHLFIVKQWILSTNLWKKVTSNLTGKTENTYYVKTFNLFIDILRDIGYDCEWAVLNTKDFLPQSRPRVYIVGHLRDGTSFEPVLPIFGARGADDDLQRQEEGKKAWLPCLTTRYVRERVRVHSLQQRNPNRPSLKYSKGGSGHLSRDGDHSYCIDTTNMQAIELEERSVMRKLTPVECERLQGFPDNFTSIGYEPDLDKNIKLRRSYLGSLKRLVTQGLMSESDYDKAEWNMHRLGKDYVPIPDSQRYKCLGNAVTVDVVEYIAERLLSKKGFPKTLPKNGE